MMQTLPRNTLVSGDFARYLRLNRSLTDEEKLQALQNHFIPTDAFKFPVHTKYGKKRSFQLSWLKDYKWLVYSPKEDGAYFRKFVLFGTATGIKTLTRLISWLSHQ